MAARLLGRWGLAVVKNLPAIFLTANELYKIFLAHSNSKEEKETVNEAVKLLDEQQGDIDRLMEDKKKLKAVLVGLTLLMDRLNEHYDSQHNHHSPPSELSDDEDEDGGAASSESSSRGGSCKKSCVCRSNYNMTDRRPTILTCGHTFCLQCVERPLTDGSLMSAGEVAQHGLLLCPTCQTHEKRPSSQLPPNVVLMVILEEEDQMRENGTQYYGDRKKKSSLSQEREELLMQMIHQMSLQSM